MKIIDEYVFTDSDNKPKEYDEELENIINRFLKT